MPMFERCVPVDFILTGTEIAHDWHMSVSEVLLSEKNHFSGNSKSAFMASYNIVYIKP